MAELLAANLVRVLHLILIAFIIIVPFYSFFGHFEKMWPFYVLHLTLGLSLLVHWHYHNDACFLTLVECKLRGIEPNQSFVHSVVSPVYKIEDETISLVSHWGVPVLMGLAAWQLFKTREDMQQDLKMVYSHWKTGSRARQSQ